MFAILSLKVFSSLFLAIVFLQSGLDKVFNYKGNKEWLEGHFSKSPLKNWVGFMIPVITLLEVMAGLASCLGCIWLLVDGSIMLALIGAQLSALSIIALFFGQRLAQDYEGASTLTGYFLIAMMTIAILTYL